MNLLAIETSTDACSVALLSNGKMTLEFAVIPRQHTQEILVMLESLLHKSGISFSHIDVLAFGCGPGSFTGLRIAASVVQGLAISRDLPVVQISTLNALAQGAYRKFKATHVFSCLDARMNEVYGGYYRLDPAPQQMKLFLPEFLSCPTAVNFPEEYEWVGSGSGCRAYLPVFRKNNHFIEREGACDIHPSADAVAELAAYQFEQGKYVSASEALPVYFRDKVTS